MKSPKPQSKYYFEIYQDIFCYWHWRIKTPYNDNVIAESVIRYGRKYAAIEMVRKLKRYLGDCETVVVEDNKQGD